MAFFGLSYGVYQKPVCAEMASDVSDLTFIYISFVKIFCQNKVKKIVSVARGFPSETLLSDVKSISFFPYLY